MIRIAFCDDDAATLTELRGLLNRYRGARRVEIEDTAFRSPLELISEIERGARYDVLFLDVLMPGENGIDAAGEIRSLDSNVKIIFLTSSSEFAVQSYAVSAYFYQLKPIWADSFFRLMDSVLSACEKEQENSILLRCRTGIVRILLSQLEYCEVIRKTIFFHMASGRVYESVGNMEQISGDLLRRGHFFRVHRSYTVNLDYITEINSHAVIMNCRAEIPIPRGKFSQIKDAFLARSFEQRWEDHE